MAKRRRSRGGQFTRAVSTRARSYYYRARRRYGRKKISIGRMVGIAVPSLLTVQAYRQYAAGMFDNGPATTIEAHLNCLLRGFLRTWTGYTWFGPSMGYKWASVGDTFKGTYMPMLAGFAAHYVANRVGINRAIKRIPLVQI